MVSTGKVRDGWEGAARDAPLLLASVGNGRRSTIRRLFVHPHDADIADIWLTFPSFPALRSRPGALRNARATDLHSPGMSESTTGLRARYRQDRPCPD